MLCLRISTNSALDRCADYYLLFQLSIGDLTEKNSYLLPRSSYRTVIRKSDPSSRSSRSIAALTVWKLSTISESRAAIVTTGSDGEKVRPTCPCNASRTGSVQCDHRLNPGVKRTIKTRLADASFVNGNNSAASRPDYCEQFRCGLPTKR